MEARQITAELEEGAKLNKQQIEKNDAKFRLISVKTFIKQGKPDIALRYATELVRIHPESAEAREAQTIIDNLTQKD